MSQNFSTPQINTYDDIRTRELDTHYLPLEIPKEKEKVHTNIRHDLDSENRETDNITTLQNRQNNSSTVRKTQAHLTHPLGQDKILNFSVIENSEDNMENPIEDSIYGSQPINTASNTKKPKKKSKKSKGDTWFVMKFMSTKLKIICIHHFTNLDFK